MDTTTSADGTTIAYSVTGNGRTIVVVNGALTTAADAAPLADALTDAGFRAVTWDRRARGGSGDRPGSTPEDETADLAAVIDAVGGADAVLGHSSGAVLALYAGMRDVAVGALFLSEPPIDFDGTGFGESLPERLQAFVDAGRGADAIAAFQRDAIGLPEEMIEAARERGELAALAPLAQSAVYDTRLTLRLKTPPPGSLTARSAVTVLRGEQTFPFLTHAADVAAVQIPHAELVIVPESVMHRLDPAATAWAVSTHL